ncbi:hypothetical protein ILUMI_07513 [Ignelater luminosus]|uniref:Uncharacterized protein n=1 Tax=Ignelater luminosus TaxID=2038154 RepID=A0A8K0GG96_IGNLU|nr:hypothetical protein ILUMI_07513 [Ignelater luminosus]
MKFLIFGLLAFFAISIEAKYDFSETAKNCLTEIKSDEDTVRGILEEDKLFPEDNELAVKFFECMYHTNINDDNEMIVDDKMKHRVTEILTDRLDGKEKLAALIADDCLEHCKDRKGDSKGKTAIKVVNCIRERTWEYMKTEN